MAVGPIYPKNDIFPYMAWNRLESRPRQREFKRALKAEIHDPLWMVSRQWQMGEFKGNDTGSGILARVQMDYFKIGGISAPGQPPTPYNSELPLEPLVESIRYDWSLKERVLMGRKWQQFLKASLSATKYNSYIALFNNTSYPFAITQLPIPTATQPDADILAATEGASNTRVRNFIAASALAGLKIDGGILYDFLKSSSWVSDIQAQFTTLTISGITIDLSAARNQYIEWMQKAYTLPEGAGTWKNNTLDYQFETHWPMDASSDVRLSAPHYHQGHFDWYSFVQTNNPAVANPVVTTKALQLILSQNRFAGMPNSRWWEFENGGVNFCDIDGNTTDIAKIIVTQFALVYQDDWFVVPFKVPVGSYSSVRGIVVTDVFGVTTFVANYPINAYNSSGFSDLGSNEWKDWRWMDISKQSAGPGIAAGTQQPAGRQVVLPIVPYLQQGAPIEKVAFVRDEVADVVWGIEKVVPDGLGKGIDGYERARAFLELLKGIKASEPLTPNAIPDPRAQIRYKLNTNDIPENWIPFMPVHITNSNRDIQFQRAMIPRILDKYATSLVRPRTSLLRTGLGASYQPYYINEEEVTRAGTIVETTMQRTRWYGGKVVSWVGRRKFTGRGHGSSNLAYDRIEDVE